MRFYFVAGEPSGDARGAEVMRAIRERAPGSAFAGFGGPRMAELAEEGFENWTDRAAVIGIIDVLRNYGFFRERLEHATEEVVRTRPDALVLIDYPGFNLRLAKAVRARAPGQRIIYYISPQVWAWHRERIRMMARVLDLMICIFPFEKPLYERSGLKTVFVGHPLADAIRAESGQWTLRDAKLVGLFPGSRRREVKKIFPVMLGAAEELLRGDPELRFEASAASEEMGERMHGMLAQEIGVPCEIRVRTAHDLMRRASVGMVASGTATLEAAFIGLPHVILYKAAWLTFFLGRKIVKVEHLGIVNILAGREVVTEYLQEKALPGLVGAGVRRLLEDAGERERLLREVSEVIAPLSEPGASARAAEAILDEVG